MRAVVVGEAGELELREVPAPEPRDGETLIRVAAVGVCGSDVEKLGDASLAGSVLGHEVAGVVEAGPGAGTRVTLLHRVPCGTCDACASGHETVCPQYLASGLRPGGFAERLVASGLHAPAIVPLPDAVPDVAATFAEPLACVLRACEQLPRGHGAVVGCGAVGLLALRVLARRGDDLCAVDIDARRLELARPHAEAGGAAELDYALVTAPDGIGEALAALRPGGTCLVFAARRAPVLVDLDLVYRRELVVRGSRSATPRYLRAAVDLLAEGLEVADLATDVLPLDAFADGLARYRRREALKVVLRP
jgi:L-iditol 2-dehydrogenase